MTEADLAVNDMLCSTLRAARPDYGWLSEETEDGAARQDSERLFIIDPIDGTRAFMAGEETFAHSLAVAEGGRVTAAVVYLPALDRLYTACDHGPALCDGQPITASTRAGIDGASLLDHHAPASRPSTGRAACPTCTAASAPRSPIGCAWWPKGGSTGC